MIRPVPRLRHMIPRISLCRWGGADTDGLFDYHGRALSIEWLGCIVEICIGKARQ